MFWGVALAYEEDATAVATGRLLRDAERITGKCSPCTSLMCSTKCAGTVSASAVATTVARLSSLE